MIGLIVLPILLPLAAYSGFYLGKRHAAEKKRRKNFFSRYYTGLNYLLNQESDKAIDLFTKLFSADKESHETHLALGSLFRRRGEIERAIRFHRRLLERTKLTAVQRTDALLELGRDYLAAGVFDRAEAIFVEIVEAGKGHLQTALFYLLDIYQQEKAWEKAIQIAKRLRKMTGNSMNPIIAHHYCEMAEIEFKNEAYSQGLTLLADALAINPKSVRASLLQAKCDAHHGRYEEAINAFQRIKEQDPDYLSQAIHPMVSCYEKAGKKAELIEFLKQTLTEFPRISITLLLAKQLQEENKLDQAIDFVTTYLGKHPSIRGLHQLIEWHVNGVEGKVREKLQVLQDVTRRLLANKPTHRCSRCGYAGQQLYWQCPGCKHWDSVKPIQGLEGD